MQSAHADIFELEFKGEVIADSNAEPRRAIVSQLFYTIGGLTAFDANGRVGQVRLVGKPKTTSVTEASIPRKKIAYTARLPVAWPKDNPKGPAPQGTFELVVPKRVTADGLSEFARRYDGICGRNEYGSDSFWHDFNPRAEGCAAKLGDDVLKIPAKVVAAERVSENKAPEYKEIWKDGVFKTVVVFGYIRGADDGDPTVREHDKLSGWIDWKLKTSSHESKTDGAADRDTTIRGQIAPGKKVETTLLLAGDMRTIGPKFDARFAALTEDADLIVYSGHSGLSENINAFLRKGTVPLRKYQVMFLNGCNSFAYADGTAEERRRQKNGAALDPNGTKFLDTLVHALPAMSYSAFDSISAVYEAILEDEQNATYADILGKLPAAELALVTGEDDNP